ncbi:transmembrane protein 62-like [Varroa destructor]|uniref:Transmembrane protein 62 n=1 Tax=Varroa destructor TaxID=109461 RepID=A0A7M7KZU6_VARDE|nr:transmembrane protein 62-like [Varroa destructor]XP_022671623.1 transmembrane protein 62-like [Varroa destructor]XP_022671624.1 transmembrane protein 62-like [Varroa destructor]
MLGGDRSMGRILLLLCGLFAFGLLVVTSGGGGPSGSRSNVLIDSENGGSVVNKLLGDTAKKNAAIKTKRDHGRIRGQQTAHVFPDDHYRRLMHFVQVTDVHVSMYRAHKRISDFASFVNDTILRVIKPPVVIMSGDIVDSLGSSYMASDQNLPEWVAYRKVLDDSKVTEKLQWLDIRGNHDNLNLASVSSSRNMYRMYSEKGRTYEHSYHYIHDQGDEKIAFLGIDTCMDPGSRRPFNFFGQLTLSRFDELLNLREQTADANYTIWFGHHPSAVVFGRNKQGLGMRSLFANSGPYLCGHYHTVFNLVQHMYAMHDDNALELELGDFKENRKFRVLSIDHGLLNFIDVTFKKYPIILVTNPKNALFHLPTYEPLERIRDSTHIRVLVFSDEPIIEVKLSLDDADEIYLTQVDKTPLFVVPWKPVVYAQGLHKLRVTAEDGQGRSGSVSFEFSVDGSRPSFELLGRLALHISRQLFIVALLCIIVFIIGGPLIILRIRYTGPSGHGIRNLGNGLLWGHPRTVGERSAGSATSHGTDSCTASYNGKNSCVACPCSRFLFQLTLLVSIDRLFYPLIAFPIYICIGPWFLGAIVEEHLGICFLWGTFVDGSFIPGGIIFFYALLLLLVYYIPFVVLLSSRVHTTYASHFHTVGSGISMSRGTAQNSGASLRNSTDQRRAPPSTNGRVKPLLSALLRNMRAFSLMALIAFQLLWASWFWFSFSWISVVFGFVPTGGLVFTAVLWRMASVLPRSLFCRSVVNLTHREGGQPSQTTNPASNNRSRNSSPLPPLIEAGTSRRTYFRDGHHTVAAGPSEQYHNRDRDRDKALLLLAPEQVKLTPKNN